MKDLGIKDEGEYNRLMEKCHFGLEFPASDSVYGKWLEVRGRLGVNVAETSKGAGLVAAGSDLRVVIVYPHYNQVEIDGKRDNFRRNVVVALAYMIRSQKESVRTIGEPMFDRIALCHELKIPEGTSRFTAPRDALRNTPFEKLVCSLEQTNKYKLNVDMSRSRVDEP
jgi:hypothetical protein